MSSLTLVPQHTRTMSLNTLGVMEDELPAAVIFKSFLKPAESG
jgi:hypothetical protein